MAFPENVDRTHLVLVREASKYKKNSLILFGSASHVLGSEYNLTKWVFLRNREKGDTISFHSSVRNCFSLSQGSLIADKYF